MKKVLFLFFISIIEVSPLMSQTFVSDKQSSIAKRATKIVEYPPHERIIVLDSLDGIIRIELLDGRILKRNIAFVTHTYDAYGLVYNGYYVTPQKEKIYIRNNEIGFHAMETLGCFITYNLKGTKQPTAEEEKVQSEESMYKNILQLHGLHDADCYKYKRIEKGINYLTVVDIMDTEPLFDEIFWKDDKYIQVVVYSGYIVRFVDLKVDKVIKIEK